MKSLRRSLEYINGPNMLTAEFKGRRRENTSLCTTCFLKPSHQKQNIVSALISHAEFFKLSIKHDQIVSLLSQLQTDCEKREEEGQTERKRGGRTHLTNSSATQRSSRASVVGKLKEMSVFCSYSKQLLYTRLEKKETVAQPGCESCLVQTW